MVKIGIDMRMRSVKFYLCNQKPDVLGIESYLSFSLNIKPHTNFLSPIFSLKLFNFVVDAHQLGNKFFTSFVSRELGIIKSMSCWGWTIHHGTNSKYSYLHCPLLNFMNTSREYNVTIYNWPQDCLWAISLLWNVSLKGNWLEEVQFMWQGELENCSMSWTSLFSEKNPL